MEHIKQNFSIKDLEHLSGIKAHTIRIWEKRYNILTPTRTDTNIRSYDLENLQKILNIKFLNGYGYKISRIAKLTDPEMGKMVKNVAATASEQNRAINSFKISMINFDVNLFHSTYATLQKSKKFREIFNEIFIPLLNEIGLLWQTDTINPVHEHFLVGLIKQKIYLNTALLDPLEKSENSDLYVLFLPENEIHDLGLLYLNYELNLQNKKTIYLGPSMPLKDMKYLLEIHPNPIFISYLTIQPLDPSVYIEDFNETLSKDGKVALKLFGSKVKSLDAESLPKNIEIFSSLSEFSNQLSS